MYWDHFSRLSILIVTFMGCHYRTTTIIRRKKDAKNTQFSFHFCLYVVLYIQTIWVTWWKGSILWQTILSLIRILNRAYTNNKKPREKEHNSYIWWPLHYCLSFCIEQDVKYFIYYILHIGLWLRLYIYCMYVVQGMFLAWPCTMGTVSHPNWLKNISSFLCGFD